NEEENESLKNEEDCT
ncbi:hypothetical protein CISIN_1g0470291mg, partial [Citrus sinensis]